MTETHNAFLDQIAPAFLKAQADMQHAVEDSSNPHFKSRYASLGAFIDAVKPSLNKHGISFFQRQILGEIEGAVTVETTLLHESGQQISSTVRVPLNKPDAHGIGSALTYAKRYGLAALCGIASEEDDDGNAAAIKVISPAEAGEIAAALDALNADQGAFLKNFNVMNVEDIPASGYKRAQQLIERKRSSPLTKLKTN